MKQPTKHFTSKLAIFCRIGEMFYNKCISPLLLLNKFGFDVRTEEDPPGGSKQEDYFFKIVGGLYMVSIGDLLNDYERGRVAELKRLMLLSLTKEERLEYHIEILKIFKAAAEREKENESEWISIKPLVLKWEGQLLNYATVQHNLPQTWEMPRKGKLLYSDQELQNVLKLIAYNLGVEKSLDMIPVELIERYLQNKSK
jgi:hypothetical protein